MLAALVGRRDGVIAVEQSCLRFIDGIVTAAAASTRILEKIAVSTIVTWNVQKTF